MNKLKKAETLENKLIPFFSSAQIVFLSLAIVAMFASQGKYLLQNMNVVYYYSFLFYCSSSLILY